MITDNVLPTTSELFTKHFGDTCAVSMSHPKIENFFEELNQVCLKEDELKLKQLNKQP